MKRHRKKKTAKRRKNALMQVKAARGGWDGSETAEQKRIKRWAEDERAAKQAIADRKAKQLSGGNPENETRGSDRIDALPNHTSKERRENHQAQPEQGSRRDLVGGSLEGNGSNARFRRQATSDQSAGGVMPGMSGATA